MNKLTVGILKKRIVRAIKSGNNKSHNIIEACDAELWYSNFCKAIAELQVEGKVIYKSGLGYAEFNLQMQQNSD